MRGRRLACAVLGLGETGGHEDGPTLIALLRHPVSAVRAAALVSLARLGAPDVIPHAIAALGDARSSVVSAARNILLARGFAVPLDAVAGALATAAPHGRRAALRVLGQLDFWERLPPILAATLDPEASVRRQARSLVTGWLARQNRVAHAPAKELRARIQGALSTAAIADDERDTISAILRARAP
jgi:HEAT repeat protein